MALIKYTSIINSFVSTEGSAGFMTNYIYYSVLVVYTDGTKDIVEGQKAQIAPFLLFLRTPIDELQDIKQLITSLPDDISNISNKIDENINYVLDTICPIPDVRGMKEEEAIKQIEEFGLVPNISQSDIVSNNQGTVSFLQRNRFNFKHVDIGITHSIPAVDGLTKDVAIEVLEKAGFLYNIKYIPSLEHEHDIVLEYSRSNDMSPVVELIIGVISKEEQKRIAEQRRKEEEQKRLEEQRKREEEQKRLEEERKIEEQKRLEEERKIEEQKRQKEDEIIRLVDLNGKDKFICTSCGTTSSGWYPKCSHCGATGKVVKNTVDLIRQIILPTKLCPDGMTLGDGGTQRKKETIIDIDGNLDTNSGDATQESQTVYRFVCRSCGTKNTGWYQKCPNCGVVGKMEKLPKAETIIESNDIPSKKEEEQKRLEEEEKRLLVEQKNAEVQSRLGFYTNMPHIFYCKNCGAAFGGISKNKPEKCEKCNYPISETTITREEWRTLSSEQKVQALFDDGILTQEEYEAKKRKLQEK